MSTWTRTDDITLVIGGTGKTGRRVGARLAASGHPVRVGTRSATPRFDWDAETTWPSALAGVRSAYQSYAPDLGLPGAADRVAAFAAAARGAGVHRLVMLSGRGQLGHAAAERAVQESGLEWTIVRSAWFAQNFTEDFAAGMVAEGTLALPAGEAAEPFVDADDLADVAVAALSDSRHHEHVYEVTGPRLLRFADVADEISAATGRAVRYQPISPGDFAAGLGAAGVPGYLVTVLGEVFAELREGRNATTGDGVQRALGRPPRDFTAFARDASAAGDWPAPVTARA